MMESEDKKVSLSDEDMVTESNKGTERPEEAAKELSKNNPSDFSNADGKDRRKADGRDPYQGSAQDKDNAGDETHLGDASGS